MERKEHSPVIIQSCFTVSSTYPSITFPQPPAKLTLTQPTYPSITFPQPPAKLTLTQPTYPSITFPQPPAKLVSVLFNDPNSFMFLQKERGPCHHTTQHTLGRGLTSIVSSPENSAVNVKRTSAHTGCKEEARACGTGGGGREGGGREGGGL